MTRPATASLWLPAFLAGLALCPALSPPARAAAPPVRGKVGGNHEVVKLLDVAYRDKDADPIKHKLDFYYPKGLSSYPVVFFVHGGTWRSGDKKIYGPLGELFARNGVGIVITNYRLSPKVKHPAHIEDVAGAFAWAHKNVGRYGGRNDRLFACGHSAGGHLVALLATDGRYLRAEKLPASSVRGVLALSGVYTIAPGLFPTQFGDDAEVCRAASPLSNVSGGHAPFLILYADKDLPFLDRLAESMHKALDKAKCQTELLRIAGRDHVSIMVKIASDETDPGTVAMLRFVARHSGCDYVPAAAPDAKKEQ